MNNQILIIYKFKNLYQILEEIEKEFNFKLVFVLDQNSLIQKIKDIRNYLILSDKKLLNFENQLIINHFPQKISKLIEKINVEFLKKQFNAQSQYHIDKYLIDLNSREISFKSIKLKLTEKEINTIIYLSKSKKPITIIELLSKVWNYQADLETHTVETHIYRLRKKIFDTFNDECFITNSKIGYQVRK